ncbi:PilN family type IVB pilus formation outer membrane protein [Xenorhabdus nematophila]|uniref:PilN family type IVB pilus formation outer membrane protein n=1 Tax=Xenorhabdus nematophila TaxID=628 RepID=UPI0032B72907
MVNLTPIAQPSLAKFAKKIPACDLTLNVPAGLSLHEVAQRITKLCGFPVTVTPDAAELIEDTMPQSMPTQIVSGKLPTPDDDGRVPLNSMGEIDGSNQKRIMQSTQRTLNSLNWQGDISGLLDNVANRLGIFWKYENERITFFRFETRVFQLAVLNAKTEMESSILSGSTSSMGATGSSTGNGISGDGATSQKTTVQIESDLYNDIRKTIETMLTPQNGRYFLATGSGSLSVTDTPVVMEHVEAYVDHQNTLLNRSVQLNVEVLSVSNIKNEQYGINWNTIYKDLGSVGATLTGGITNAASNAVSAGVSILDPNSKFNGSRALFQALSEQGNVSVETTSNSTTTNLTPVPIQVAEQTVYIQSTSTTVTANVGESTSMTPGVITTGFNMNMLPYIKNGSDIQLQFSFNLSDPPTIRTVTSKDGNSTIEMPYTKLRSLSQRVNMKAGQTLILTGFEQINTKMNKDGVFSANNYLFGGGRDGKKNRSSLVVLITPILM